MEGIRAGEHGIGGVLFDLDGTLAVASEPVPGAPDAVRELRARRVPMAIVTNTTRLSRAALVTRLRGAGFEFTDAEIFTVPAIASSWLLGNGCRRVLPLLARATWPDLAGVEIVESAPAADRGVAAGAVVDAVLVGDPGPELTWDALNGAFRAVMGGARLVAGQRNRYWQEPDGLSIDAGALVVALEYAAGVTAELVGKPAPAFFLRAAAYLGLEPSRLLMVGDDLEADVRGAQAAGLLGCQVRTGKFREADLATPGRTPDLVVASVADLPAALAASRL